MIQRMVLFGASGDLTSRLLLPAVSQLAERDSLPPGLTIVGAANTDWSTQDFREHIAARLREHSRASAAAQARVVDMLAFEPADVTDPVDVRRVIGQGGPSTLVYLALPPVLLPAVLAALASADLRAEDAVAIEKPFGTDLASARQLNQTLRIQLPAPTIFRVDHFLSDELVRRVVSLRFLNRVFAPAWNAENIERVDISWLEDLTLEGRASYYDGAGAMKDMLQNHLMEVMAARRNGAACSPGCRLVPGGARGGAAGRGHPCCGADARDDRAGALHRRHDRRPRGPLVRRRARRGPGAKHRDVCRAHPRPQHPPLVGSTIHDPLGQGPRAALCRDRRALPRPSLLPDRPVAGCRGERPADRPDRALRAAVHDAQRPESRTAEQRQLETTSAAPPLTAYAHLIEHMLHNDPMLFIRSDEAEESWRIVDPVMQAWSSGAVELQEYPAGGAAPGPAG